MALDQIALRLRTPWGARTISNNRRIFGAALLIAALTFAAKLLAMGKDVAVAASFGTTDTLDAFLMAILLPNFVATVITGSFNAALVPTYIRVREREGPESAQRLFAASVVISATLLAGATLVLALVGPGLLAFLAPGFAPAKLLLTRQLFYLLLPLVFLNGIATNWGAVLNAREKFGLVALAPALVPLATIATLLAGGAAWGGYALAAGTVAGFALQLTLLAVGLRRQGLGLLPRWTRNYGRNADLRQVVGQIVPMLAAGLLMNSTILVDQAFASLLDPGSVAALGYGTKFVSFITSITTVAIGTAVLPYLSRMVAAADWPGVRHTLRTYTRLIAAATVPPTLLVALGSGVVVRLLFQHGAFTSGDTALVAKIQAMYILQVPCYTLAILFVRLISSLRVGQVLVVGNLINFAVNIILDYVLMRRFGVVGIALGTSLVYLVSCAFLGTMAYRLLRDRQTTGGASCA